MEITTTELRNFFEDLKRKLDELAAKRQTITITRPVIVNIPMASANTEYPSGGYQIPDGAVSIRAKTRDGTAFRLAFERDVVATSAAVYYTVAASEVYKDRGLNTSGARLYAACGSTGKIVEVICWVKEEVR